MRSRFTLGLLALGMLTVVSCKKKDENVTVSQPPYQVGQPVSDAAPLSGSIKGTMLTGKTYTINGDVTINKGDTLLIQKGVTVNVSSNASINVKGTLLSLGSKEQPIWLTAPGMTKMDNVNQDPATDPAYSGKWAGINCDTSCKLLVIKWTHIEYVGSTFNTPPPGYKQGDNSFGIFFENQNGVFVLEDSWFYGTVDDAIRIAGGKFSVMRNTFEKCGGTGGDVVNAKSGSVGDMAYNLFVGAATNGTKASNKGSNTIQTNVNMYNNTYVNGGYRRVESGRGGSINYEEGAKGMYYNNLMVDCRFGPRVVKTPPADTVNMKYGYSYDYADSVSSANQVYPTGYITHPQSSDFPAPSTFLPSNYKLGDNYNGSSIVGKNDPKFKNYPLPNYSFKRIAYVNGFDFRLASGSPAIGKGNTGFSALSVVPVDEKFGATEITGPGADMGAYQSNGKGNQHY